MLRARLPLGTASPLLPWRQAGLERRLGQWDICPSTRASFATVDALAGDADPTAAADLVLALVESALAWEPN